MSSQRRVLWPDSLAKRMRKMNLTLKHLYYIFRYGTWSCGWEMWKGKPMFAFEHIYYDGHHLMFHFYKFYVGVSE